LTLEVIEARKKLLVDSSSTMVKIKKEMVWMIREEGEGTGPEEEVKSTRRKSLSRTVEIQLRLQRSDLYLVEGRRALALVRIEELRLRRDTSLRGVTVEELGGERVLRILT
jgi:hypothetical protein